MSEDAIHVTSSTARRNEILGRMQDSLDAVIRKNPEIASHASFEISRYGPGFDFVIACEEYLDDSQQERYKAAMGRYLGLEPPISSTPAGEEVDVFDEVRGECRALLSGRPDLQSRWDEVYGDRQMWEKMHSVVAEGKKKNSA